MAFGAEVLDDSGLSGADMDYADASKKLKESKSKLDSVHHDLIDNLTAKQLEDYDADTTLAYSQLISDLQDFMESPEEIEELQDELLELQEWLDDNSVMAQAQMGGGDTAPEADTDDAPEGEPKPKKKKSKATELASSVDAEDLAPAEDLVGGIEWAGDDATLIFGIKKVLEDDSQDSLTLLMDGEDGTGRYQLLIVDTPEGIRIEVDLYGTDTEKGEVQTAQMESYAKKVLSAAKRNFPENVVSSKAKWVDAGADPYIEMYLDSAVLAKGFKPVEVTGDADSSDLETAPEGPDELAQVIQDLIVSARESGDDETQSFVLDDGTKVDLVFSHHYSQVEVWTSKQNEAFEQTVTEATEKLSDVGDGIWSKEPDGRYSALLNVQREAPPGHPHALEWTGDPDVMANAIQQIAEGPAGNSMKLFTPLGTEGNCIVYLAKMQGTEEVSIMINRVGESDDENRDAHNQLVKERAKWIARAINFGLKGVDTPDMFIERWTGTKDIDGNLTVSWLLDAEHIGDVHPIGVEEVEEELAEIPLEIQEQIEDQDFWRKEEIIYEPSDLEGVKGVTKIPIGGEYLLVESLDNGFYKLRSPHSPKKELLYSSLDDVMEDAALMQRMLSETLTGRWSTESDEPFDVSWGTGMVKFDPMLGGFPSEILAVATVPLGGTLGAMGGALYGTVSPVRHGFHPVYKAGETGDAWRLWDETDFSNGLKRNPITGMITGSVRGTYEGWDAVLDSNENFEHGNTDMLLGMMNDWYGTVKRPERKAYTPPEGSDLPEDIVDEINADGIVNDRGFYSPGDVEAGVEDGVTKISFRVGAAQINVMGIYGQQDWKVETPGGPTVKADSMEHALKIAKLVENLMHEVSIGKYQAADEVTEPWGRLGEMLYFDAVGTGAFTNFEINHEHADAQLLLQHDERGDQIVALLNAVHADVQVWDMPEPEEKEEDADDKEGDADDKKDEDKDRDEGRTDDSDGGGGGGDGGGDGGRDTAGGDDHSHGGGGGSHGGGGGAERSGGGSGGRTDGGLDGGRDTTRKPDGTGDDKEDEDDTRDDVAERPPTDEERYETHKSLTILNALAQTAFGRNKDYRARIMRKMRKCRRGKAEGRDGRTKYPVIRLTKMEIKDGQVTMSFADSVSDSGNVITYTAAAENPKPDSKSSAGKINYEGVEFKNTASNREALKALFKGSIFRFKEKPSYVRTDLLGSGPAEAALDTKNERKALRESWDTMKGNIKDYIKDNSKARVCFGSRIPVIMNKNVKMRYKGDKVKLNLVLDYEMDEDGGRVTLKVKDESGKIYPTWKDGVDDAISKLGAGSSGGRKSKRKKKR